MAKNSWNDYSATAASNTDVGGVDIQGTAPASNMDDMGREIMSHTAEVVNGTTPVKDTFTFCDPADTTKRFRFDGGSVTAGQTRVMTIPDADMTLGNIPGTNDGAALGSATKSWSDLFLASGGVVNWNNGDYTITHSSGTLTFSGVIAASSTIELGHASDTTLSRGAAGFLAVEGKRVPSPASQAAGDILYRGSTEWERLAKGTASQVLTMNAGATAPEWATLSVDYGAGNAALSAGAVGTYAMAGAVSDGSSPNFTMGSTYAGSTLKAAGATSNSGASAGGATLSGTWRAMGTVASGTNGNHYVTLFLRIS